MQSSLRLGMARRLSQTFLSAIPSRSMHLSFRRNRWRTLPVTTCVSSGSYVSPQTLSFVPYKLVIYNEGGHFHEHRDTVRGEGHIGTLVVILNSEYTGGELEVSHDGRTETVTGAYSWVAMYGDCLHKINPVTSGTRVSLIYDIYKQTGRKDHSEDGDEEENEEEGPDDTEQEGEGAGSEDDKEDQNDDVSEQDEKEGDDDDEDFWGGRHHHDPVDTVREADAKVKSSIKKEVDRELKKSAQLTITLQQLYPECQTSPAFLKGGDRALYDLLSGQYDVQVVAATIYRSHDYEDSYGNCVRWGLFSPSIMAQALEDSKKPRAYAQPRKKQKIEKLPRTKIVIPHTFREDNVLDYTPYIEYTGNESQQEETVYIVAGLQVRKKM